MRHLIFIASGAALMALVFWMVSVRRDLIVMKKNSNNAMAQIGVQLFSQCELLTSILDLTNWYAPEECITIIKTMKAGRSITKDSSTEDVKKQEKVIVETKTKIMDVAEICAELKSDRSYIKSMEAIHQYENMLQTSRLIYNDSAAKLNRAIRMFPTSLIAGILGFSNLDYLEERKNYENGLGN